MFLPSFYIMETFDLLEYLLSYQFIKKNKQNIKKLMQNYNKELKMINEISKLLGDESDYLLKHECKTVSKDKLHLPGSDFIDRVVKNTDRPNTVFTEYAASV